MMMMLPRHISLHIAHQPHAVSYMSIDEWIESYLLSAEAGGTTRDQAIDPADLAAIRATGEVWVIDWCPDTPVGSCTVAAATIERALELAIRSSL
jgi:hypothetical protein